MGPLLGAGMMAGGAALGALGAGQTQGVDKGMMDWAIWKLSPEAIGNRYASMQSLYAPMLASMGEAAQVGANMDTQTLQANLARQGLGGTGLGAALGAGMRSGATFRTNQLRAQLAAEAMNQSIGLQSQGAGFLAQGAMAGAGQAQNNPWQGAILGAGYGAETASLFS